MGNYYLILTAKRGKEKHELQINKDSFYVDVKYVIYENDKEKSNNGFSLSGTPAGPINERDIKSIISNISKMFKGDVTDEFITRLNEYKSFKYVDNSINKVPVKKKN